MVKKTVISVIYKYPAPQYDSFTKELENILRNLNDNKVTYYICGDFNINFLQHESSQQVKIYQFNSCLQLHTTNHQTYKNYKPQCHHFRPYIH